MPDGRLARLLDRALAEPARTAEIAAHLDQLYGREAAVLVADMAGFTRLTAGEGIVAALLAIRRFQIVARDCVETRGGQLVKFDADNAFAVFATLAAGQLAAEAIAHAVPASVGIGFGRVLVIDGDLFGEEVNFASKLGEDIATAGEILFTAAAAARATSST